VRHHVVRPGQSQCSWTDYHHPSSPPLYLRSASSSARRLTATRPAGPGGERLPSARARGVCGSSRDLVPDPILELEQVPPHGESGVVARSCPLLSAPVPLLPSPLSNAVSPFVLPRSVPRALAGDRDRAEPRVVARRAPRLRVRGGHRRAKCRVGRPAGLARPHGSRHCARCCPRRQRARQWPSRPIRHCLCRFFPPPFLLPPPPPPSTMQAAAGRCGCPPFHARSSISYGLGYMPALL